jgi:heat shock protein HtpX
MSGAVVIQEPQTLTEIWLMKTVRVQADIAGIKMPEVAVFDSPEVNAFATGMTKNSALVAVSSGLLNAMSKDEAEAVLAHEVSHIANGDMVTLTLIQGVVNTFVMFFSRVIGYTVDKVIFKTEKGTGPAFFISMIIAARLTSANKMIAALQRLQAVHEPSVLPKQMVASGIAGGQANWAGLFASHPSLSARIAALGG